jgi:hypothetical protein
MISENRIASIDVFFVEPNLRSTLPCSQKEGLHKNNLISCPPGQQQGARDV